MVPAEPPPGVAGAVPTVEPFDLGDWYGEVTTEFRPPDLDAAVRRLVDPASAEQTVHWGRNYLYRSSIETAGGARGVVVKQFRNEGLRRTLDRRWRGSKAERSWRMARAFSAAGIPTAAPVLWIESKRPRGASFFVTELLADRIEARYVLRAANEGRLAEAFPGLDFGRFLDSLGTALRNMHEAGLFHRDLSIGNVLLPASATAPAPADLAVIDLNRGRRRRRLGLGERNRDLCRLTIHRPEHQRRFLDAYWRGQAGALQRAAFAAYHYGFRAKLATKRAVRAPLRTVAAALRPRRAHAHIPRAPEGASPRDKIVWDYLSDQPHQHAGKLEKLKVRLADAPSHLLHAGVVAAAAPRVFRRYRQLRRELYRSSVPWGGVGVCVRPYPEAPDRLLQAVDDLGLRHVLLRLHPWQEHHDAEEELAQELHGRGYDLAFALPQDRQLVRDPALWRRRIEDLAERFVPYGSHFQVGQAINRSKWGVWRYGEYLRLARDAVDILRRHAGVQVLGPAVIDFELHATAAVVNLPSCPRFDALASLLYVDRRGAPENRQMGLDTVGKVLLLKAIADTARACGPASWITEVNWPLWEGPHSPAGKSVSVDEQSQADFLVRYYLLALTTGAVERVYWWQMIARGYGLVAPHDPSGDDRGLRRRAAFRALGTLDRQLRGSRFLGPLPSPPGCHLFHFERDGRQVVAGWSVDGDRRASLPRPAGACVGQEGKPEEALSDCTDVILSQSVRYFRI